MPTVVFFFRFCDQHLYGCADGTVPFKVFVTEPAPRYLEYGLGKSLYMGTSERELDFEHQHLFGGGETVGFMSRRGTKDPAPSLRVHYQFGTDRKNWAAHVSDALKDQ
jgi:hypothetical protein